MLVGDLLTLLERRAPTRLAEEWDNVGLIAGRRERSLSGLMVALDLRAAVLDEAREDGCEAVLVHHPPIFPHLDAIDGARAVGGLLLRAIEDGITVVAAHTNLDSARGGLNDLMAKMLGLSGAVPLRPSSLDPQAGLGRIGHIAPRSAGELLDDLSREFPGEARCSGERSRMVGRVACCTGSGGGLIDDAREAGADLYVTGDLRYHDADRAEDMALIDLPHAGVERRALREWSASVAPALGDAGVRVRFATADTDPWWRP